MACLSGLSTQFPFLGQRRRSDGGWKSGLVSVNRAPMEILLRDRGDHMYYTDLSGSVYSANLDGSNNKTILIGQGGLTASRGSIQVL